jgi:hypothetical protein
LRYDIAGIGLRAVLGDLQAADKIERCGLIALFWKFRQSFH